MAKREEQKKERLSQENINSQGLKMKIIEYIDATHIKVIFEDGYIASSNYKDFKKGATLNKNYKRPHKKKDKNIRLGEIKLNNDKELMKIIEYNYCDDIIVEFQDEFKACVNSTYNCFLTGVIKNPNHKGQYGQIIGNIYPAFNHGVLKEYKTWNRIINRVYNPIYWKDRPNYSKVDLVKEWLYYPNFYEWIHGQENFDKFITGKRWAIDKDILSDYNNKIYSPDTCVLVPNYINILFTEKKINDLPLGVWVSQSNGGKYAVEIKDKDYNKKTYFCNTPEEAGNIYKEYRSRHIKEIATLALNKGDITERCYYGMLNYKDHR